MSKPKDNSRALELLRELDKVMHENFPLGGHANVERAQQLANDLRKEVEKWQS